MCVFIVTTFSSSLFSLLFRLGDCAVRLKPRIFDFIQRLSIVGDLCKVVTNFLSKIMCQFK